MRTHIKHCELMLCAANVSGQVPAHTKLVRRGLFLEGHQTISDQRKAACVQMNRLLAILNMHGCSPVQPGTPAKYPG